MNPDRLARSMREAALTELRAVIAIVTAILKGKIDEGEISRAEQEQIGKDLKRLKEIKDHFDKCGVTKEDKLADVIDKLPKDMAKDLESIYNDYTCVTVNAADIRRAEGKLLENGIPFHTLTPNSSDKYVIVYRGEHDKQISALFRNENAVFHKISNLAVGMLTENKFQEKVGLKECVSLKGLSLTEVGLLNEQLISYGIIAGLRNTSDPQIKDVLYKKENEAEFKKAYFAMKMLNKTIYGQYLGIKIKQENIDRSKIEQCMHRATETNYICFRENADRYIKISPTGATYYRDGKIAESVPRSSAVEFENFVRNKFEEFNRNAVVMDEKSFKPTKKEREKFIETQAAKIYLDNKDDRTNAMVIKEKNDRKFLLDYVNDNLTKQNRNKFFDKDGMQHIAALYADYVAKYSIYSNFENLDGVNVELPESKEEASQLAANAFEAFEQSVDLFVKSTYQGSISELDSVSRNMKEGFAVFDNAEDSTRFAQQLNSVSKEMGEMEENTKKLSPTLEEEIESKFGERSDSYDAPEYDPEI